MDFKKKFQLPKKKTSQKKISQTQNSVKAHIPLRLNLLFFVVFALFVALIIQLSYLQIVKGDLFVSKIEANTKKIVEGNAPRGMIYDANQTPLVNNKPNQAILFTKNSGMSAEDVRKSADQLNQLIHVDAEDLNERDKKDYWLADPKNLETARERLTEEDKKDKKGNPLKESALYTVIVDKVKPEEIQFDEPTMQAATIFKKINGAYAMTPIYIKNHDVTDEEIALVGENVSQIPGVSTGVDWEREYPQGNFLRDILGTVTSEKAGIPAEKLDEYLAKGYARNDRIGSSYLEKQYEPILKGTKSQSEVTLNRNQEITHQKELYEGEKGKNIVLTIRKDFQEKVEEILRTNYQQLIANGKAVYSPGAYAVVLDPNNGEVLAMAGISHDVKTNEISEDTLGTINKAFVPGSSIKGATVMAGYENGVLSGNQVIVDEPIKLKESAVKKSVFNPYGKVAVNTVEALEFSSNVYMMKIALSLLGVEYQPEMSLPANTKAFSKLRNTYEEFGLGTETGIDLPGESTGLVTTDFTDKRGHIKDGVMANFLDLSYGNFDTYTPMQLAQYVSTVANGGKRIAPHIVRGIYGTDSEGNLGALEEIVEPRVLNQINRPEEFSIIQQGFYQVVNGTDYRRTGRALQDAKYTIAAKTGTAETFAFNESDPNNPYQVVNSTLVGYAPADQPKVSVVVVLPQLLDEKDGMNTLIAKELFNTYYDFYEKK